MNFSCNATEFDLVVRFNSQMRRMGCYWMWVTRKALTPNRIIHWSLSYKALLRSYLFSPKATGFKKFCTLAGHISIYIHSSPHRIKLKLPSWCLLNCKSVPCHWFKIKQPWCIFSRQEPSFVSQPISPTDGEQRPIVLKCLCVASYDHSKLYM